MSASLASAMTNARDERLAFTSANFFSRDFIYLPGFDQTFQCARLGLFDSVRVSDRCFQIFEQAVLQAVNPAVDGHVLAAIPGGLNNRCLRNVENLFDDVEFARAV